jgi:hypothetical protein
MIAPWLELFALSAFSVALVYEDVVDYSVSVMVFSVEHACGTKLDIEFFLVSKQLALAWIIVNS